MNLLNLFRRRRHHDRAQTQPQRVRKQLYQELLAVEQEEEAVRDLLRLPFAPRLSIVDEERVAIMRPADRDWHRRNGHLTDNAACDADPVRAGGERSGRRDDGE